MIDQQSAIIGQKSAFFDNANETRGNVARKAVTSSQASDVNNKEDFKNVAKEMESLFAYQLLKIMRETTDRMSDDKKENGYDAYMSLFDIEVSKLFADRGLGMQDAIISWLERSPGVTEKEVTNNKL